MDKVSEYIRQQRKARNITIEEMSKGTLISIVTLKDIESGRFDKYKGDELYIKMYLKKIATFLELDADEVTQLLDGYLALTQEIQLHDMQEKEEQLRLAEENKKNTKVVDKLGETIREVKTTSSIRRQKRQHVYKDNSVKRYLKYGIIITLCVMIICVIWYSIVATQPDDGGYTSPTSPSVNQNPDVNTDNSQNQENDDNDETEENEADLEPVSITHVTGSTYNIGLGPGDTFKLEITFGRQSLFNLFLGATQVENAYGIYNAGETYEYTAEISGNERYFLNIWNLEDVEIKINGVVLEYNPAEVSVINNGSVSRFTLFMEGE